MSPILCQTARVLFAATVLAASPLAAQTPSEARTDAILGGAPSALAAVLAQQNAVPAAATVPTAQSSVVAGLVPQPASYSPLYPNAAQYLVRPTVATDRPDVFGSVALAIGRTPLDARWHQVEYSGVGGKAATFAASLRGQDAMSRIEAVNHFVNARITFVDDSRQFGTVDRWSAASDTLRRGRGDCEDYAIAKLQMLRRAGFASPDLYLVIVKDLVRRADHAVLVVRAAGRMLVLDNGTDRILDSDAVRDYRPVFSFTAGHAWTHGYQRQAPAAVLPPVTLAALQQPIVPAAYGY